MNDRRDGPRVVAVLLLCGLLSILTAMLVLSMVIGATGGMP